MGLFRRVRNDWTLLTGALRTLRVMAPIMKNPERVFPSLISELAAVHGDRPALVSDREALTYRELDARANQYARWAQAHGVRRGDVVALLMSNRPEYLALWLGVVRAGGVAALLNTNLVGPGLAHCIDIVEPVHVIVGADLMPVFDTARERLTTAPRIWAFGASRAFDERLDISVEGFADAALSAEERPALTIEDRALLIYTSGTTGLPKAANINHYRLMAMILGFSSIMRVTPEDRMFDCLPMYDSNGGILATGATLAGGGTVIVRERFSARDFWTDVARSEATLVFYIGEVCRYLVNAPESAADRAHRVRLCCGNGLRPDIWTRFQERFAVPKIVEWYASTEGNVAVFNWDGTPGAVGRIPWWMERRFLVKVLRFDVEAEELVRGPDGLCVECAPGEVGEVVGQIVSDPARPANRFEGYADAAATSKKIAVDVLEPGDRYFRTGDLMKKDARGYFEFVDRIGDTYRWKGENVSCTEVAQRLTLFSGVEEAIVYGVSVPHHEGRAGMASLVVRDSFDISGFHAHVARELPDYARPLFVRLSHAIETTGTFKQRRIELQKEGFDPETVREPLWFRSGARGFRALDRALHDDIQRGVARL